MGDAIGTGVTESDVEGGYDETTKARLRAELRHRGLSDAGDTDDLIARLREDDEAQTDDTAQDDEAGDEEASSTEAEEDVEADVGDDVTADDGAEGEPPSRDTPEETASADEEPSDDEAGASERSSSKARSSGGKRSSSRERKGETRRPASAPSSRTAHEPPLRRAARLVTRSTGLKLDTVSRAVHEDGAWYIQVELVEVPHVPPSRDILGSYVVVIGDDGDVRALERMGQYRRKA